MSPDDEKQAPAPNRLTKVRDFAIAVSSVVSAIAIPVVGYWVSSALKNKEIEGKFVELAVSILKAEPTDAQRNLRVWATHVINNYSGVRLSDEASADLINKIVIPSSTLDGRTTSSLERLQPKAAELARQLVVKAKEKGIEIRIISGLRTIEEQEALYASGRTTPGPIITAFRRSSHNLGLAFDVGIFKDNKYIEESPEYALVGQIGKELGLIWGGDWKTADIQHFETADAQDALRKLKSTSGSAPDLDSPEAGTPSPTQPPKP
jgi:LAS superfamily LD-carboxypeptidase LdcB